MASGSLALMWKENSSVDGDNKLTMINLMCIYSTAVTAIVLDDISFSIPSLGKNSCLLYVFDTPQVWCDHPFD